MGTEAQRGNNFSKMSQRESEGSEHKVTPATAGASDLSITTSAQGLILRYLLGSTEKG